MRNEEGHEITFEVGEAKYLEHDDALVILVRMANARVKRVMFDTDSFIDMLYFDAFQKLKLMEKELSSMTSTLTGFIGDSICPLRTTNLHITFGDEPFTKTLMAKFMVVDVPSVYNVIIGHPTLN